MARKTPDIIVVNENIAIKKDESQYIICDAYRNPKTPDEVSWINKTYHGSLPKAIRALPKEMLSQEKITSFEDAYEACNRIAEHLAQLFDDIVRIEAKPIQLVIDEDYKDD